MNSDDLKRSRRIQNLVPLPVMLTLALLVLVPAPAGAASFAGTQTDPTEWTYTLTFDPLDNYAVCPPPGDVATITLSGLAGVVAATPPTSTDFPTSLDSVNLLWMPQVSNGGTVVTWTHQGPGNFSIPKHAFGFKVITGAPAVNGTVNVASDGFSRDVSAIGPCSVQPADDRDFTGRTNGPVGPPPPTTSSTTTTTLPTTTTTLAPTTTTTTTLPTTTTTLPPPPRADLEISLTDTPDPLTVRGQLAYTITVTNNGPGTATGVQVLDSLLPEATVLAGPAFSSQGKCGGTVTVVCDLGTLAARAQATVTINVIPMVTGVLSNTATVTSETDIEHANDVDTETTTVEPEDPARADLAITAAVGPMPGGQGFTYTLTVKNDGPATATGVQLTNDLPRGIALGPVTASQSQANCSDTDPMLCNLGELPSGAEAPPVTIDVFRTEGILPNRAAVNGKQHDPEPGNNFALTSALDLPTRQTTCNTKRCRLILTCNLSDLLGRNCDNQVTLFVDTRARRDTRARLLSGERAVRPPKLVRYAAVARNFPGGVMTNVPLKITSKGKKLARRLVRQGRNRLRGEMRISNAAGGIDITRLTVRLR